MNFLQYFHFRGDEQYGEFCRIKLKIYNVNTGQKFEGVIVRNGSKFMQISARNTDTGLSFGLISLEKDKLNNWRQSETENTFILL